MIETTIFEALVVLKIQTFNQKCKIVVQKFYKKQQKNQIRKLLLDQNFIKNHS